MGCPKKEKDGRWVLTVTKLKFALTHRLTVPLSKPSNPNHGHPHLYHHTGSLLPK